MKTNRKPTHAGVLFKSIILDEDGTSVKAAAEMLGVSRKHLSRFVNGHERCSLDMARRMAAYVGTGVAMWLNAQLRTDEWDAENSPVLTDVVARRIA